MPRETIHNCEECQEPLDGVKFSFQDVYYCAECFEEHIYTCESCDVLVHDNDIKIMSVGGSDTVNCTPCMDRFSFDCIECSESYHVNDSTELHDGERICEVCCENGDYSWCDECQELYHCDSVTYNDDGIWCDECKPQTSSIHNYSYLPDPLLFHHNLHGTNNSMIEPRDKKNEIYFGIELEIDRDGYSNQDKNELASSISGDESTFYCKDDSSLNCGFEIVSHPFSWDYFKSNKNDFKNNLDKARDAGYRSHDTTTCGMHIHVSKKTLSNLDIFKMVYFVYSNADFIKVVSNRNWDDLNRWCSLDLDNLLNRSGIHGSNPLKKANRIGKLAKAKTGTPKYTAINLSKSNTIEFRIFKGTLNWRSYQKNLQFVQSLVQWCKKTSLKHIQDKDAIFSYFDFITKDQTNYDNLILFLFKKFYAIDPRSQTLPPLYKQMKHFDLYNRMNFDQLTKRKKGQQR